MTWPTHCIHGRPILEEGQADWCPECHEAGVRWANSIIETMPKPWWVRLWRWLRESP